MRRILILIAVAALAIGLLPVAPALATPPADVVFEVPTEIPPSGGSFGPFTASGPAVDDGLMCPSGETNEIFGKVSGFQSGKGINIQVIKEFTCDSEPFGTFLVKLQVRIDQKGINFNWTVLGGTDAYEDLHGSGSGFGLPCGDECVFDVYEGKVHID